MDDLTKARRSFKVQAAVAITVASMLSAIATWKLLTSGSSTEYVVLGLVGVWGFVIWLGVGFGRAYGKLSSSDLK